MRVVVLLGGESEEREVSLASGCQVADALRQAGHDVVAFDPVGGALTRADEARTLAEGVGTLAPGEISPIPTQCPEQKNPTHGPLPLPPTH